MNFTPFGGHFSATIPSIHQFTAKFGHENGQNPVCQPTTETNSSRYTANGVPSFTQHHPPQQNLINTGKYPPSTYNYSHQNQQEKSKSNVQEQQQQQQSSPAASWQSLAAPGSAVADYLSHLPASTLPLSLHHFLKYSAEIKKESVNQHQHQQQQQNQQILNNDLVPGSNLMSTNASLSTINHAQLQPNPPAKKKKKKKPEKEKKPKPKPGEIRLTTALDGSTLYCCPECHMAYPEKELLEQHLVGHTLERRFVCDICGAGLKRKDHLTRHKQSHNPERPYVCTVCLKAFKRKEQLTLHFVIHSGEKRHVCTECGKGFYRKDHLRKHTRSHIARRVKAELSQQNPGNSGGVNLHSGGNTQSIIS
ncbi:zinc finger protein 684-like [Onthophagus taurus]|uniref:zinc finger protein 684-like n=1 Tax=Onthophagus taurus TaxID=166361 RepID=UPI000C20DF5E|nr:zinc finger protein 510-like [Onthophagus taurus]